MYKCRPRGSCGDVSFYPTIPTEYMWPFLIWYCLSSRLQTSLESFPGLSTFHLSGICQQPGYQQRYTTAVRGTGHAALWLSCQRPNTTVLVDGVCAYIYLIVSRQEALPLNTPANYRYYWHLTVIGLSTIDFRTLLPRTEYIHMYS